MNIAFRLGRAMRRAAGLPPVQSTPKGWKVCGRTPKRWSPRYSVRIEDHRDACQVMRDWIDRGYHHVHLERAP